MQFLHIIKRSLTLAIAFWALFSLSAWPVRGEDVCKPTQEASGHCEVIFVKDGRELQQALNNKERKIIILKDGYYDSDGVFRNVCGHQVDAEHSGKAVLRSGLSIGGQNCRSGTMVRGLVLDVDDPARTLNGHAINIWGTAEGTLLDDLRIDGHTKLETGIVIRQAQGAELKNITAQNFRSNGIVIQSQKRASFSDKSGLTKPVRLEDIRVAHVSRPVPLSSDGSAESCIWLGEPVVATRLDLRDCAWMGLWTGSLTRGSVISKVKVDDIPQGTGLYLGHFTVGSRFSDIQVGPNVKYGVKCEWGAPQWDGIAGCHDVLVEKANLDTTCVGLWLDAGTTRTTIRDSMFSGQKAFAIGDFRGDGNLSGASGNSSKETREKIEVYLGSPSVAASKCY